jgi:hypothetical protein
MGIRFIGMAIHGLALGYGSITKQCGVAESRVISQFTQNGIKRSRGNGSFRHAMIFAERTRMRYR